MNIALLNKITSPIFTGLNRLRPAWWLMIRVWMAVVFFKSGLVKAEDMETTIFLFAEEYQVPLLPPALAAWLALMVELAAPVLLVLGLAARPASLALLAMTAVIQFTYLDHLQHYYWAILLGGLLINGAGPWSLDAWLARRYSSSTC